MDPVSLGLIMTFGLMTMGGVGMTMFAIRHRQINPKDESNHP
jgi:hypothetical protein